MNRLMSKLLMNGIIAIPLLMWFTEATFWASLIVSVVFSIVAYAVGDQMILRISNNTVATLADAAMAFIYFWIVSAWMGWSLSVGELLMLTIALGVVEFIYHRMLGTIDQGERERTV